MEDFGEVILRGNGGTCYIRVDWFTPDGLDTWGDGRVIILGTEGYIELRKYCDIAGRPGGGYLFLVDREGTHYIDCRKWTGLLTRDKLVELMQALIEASKN